MFIFLFILALKATISKKKVKVLYTDTTSRKALCHVLQQLVVTAEVVSERKFMLVVKLPTNNLLLPVENLHCLHDLNLNF
jgi:hypothetical protein